QANRDPKGGAQPEAHDGVHEKGGGIRGVATVHGVAVPVGCCRYCRGETGYIGRGVRALQSHPDRTTIERLAASFVFSTIARQLPPPAPYRCLLAGAQ